MAEGGIDDGISSNIFDMEYRYELYCDWKRNLTRCSPPSSPQEFCRMKCIPFPELEEIVRTFDADPRLRWDNPIGNKWD